MFYQREDGEKMGRKMALPFPGIQCFKSPTSLSLLFHFLLDHDHLQRQELCLCPMKLSTVGSISK